MSEIRPSYHQWRLSRSPGAAKREKANKAVCLAVKSGRLLRPSACERCAAEGAVQGHHPDYNQPLVVEWLCRPCHVAHHQAERAAANAARRARLKDPRFRLNPRSA